MALQFFSSWKFSTIECFRFGLRLAENERDRLSWGKLPRNHAGLRGFEAGWPIIVLGDLADIVDLMCGGLALCLV